MSGIYRGPNSSVAAQFVNADGDKGDIVVSNSGELWTIDANVVTYDKLQTATANTLLGRSATSGQIEEIPCTAFARGILDDADSSGLIASLGFGSMANQNDNSVAITGGTITGITDLALTEGGTGASDAAGARTNLGLGSAALLTTAEVVQKTSATGTALLPSGTTAERSDSVGLRYNTTIASWEGYNGTSWGSVGGGATGGVGNQAFYENDKTISVDYTITTDKNAMTAGPVTIADGITVTVPTGSTWSIV